MINEAILKTLKLVRYKNYEKSVRVEFNVGPILLTSAYQEEKKNWRKEKSYSVFHSKKNIRTGSDEEAYYSRGEECDNYIYIL